MSACPRKVRAAIPHWVAGEVRMAVGDFVADEVVAGECPATVPCLREIAAELRKVDPSWETIQAAICTARKASPCRYRLNFDRLENRLSHLFSHRKRDWRQRP
jgi:hypothetical protein